MAFWRSNLAGHEYNNLTMRKVDTSSLFFGFGATGNSRDDDLRERPLEDTQPPVTVITSVRRVARDLLEVSGVAADDNRVSQVTVNGNPATLEPGLVAGWRALVPVSGDRVAIEASSEDGEGNRELTPHRLVGSLRDLDDLRSEPVLRRPALASSSGVPALASSSGVPALAGSSGVPAGAPAASAQMEYAVPDQGTSAGNVAVAKAAPLISPGRWPLWDGKQSVASGPLALAPPRPRPSGSMEKKLEMVLIPPGRFVMGSPGDELGHASDEGPAHEVLISQPFYLGRTEVTQAQYQAVTGGNPSHSAAVICRSSR